MNNWGKFRRLPAEEKAAFLAALALLPAVRVGLRTLGLRRVQAVLGRRLQSVRFAESENSLWRARRTARLVGVAARYTGGTCLARSVVLAYLLERQGVPAKLRIGVRNGENGFEAHAWVEAAGVSLDEGPNVGERYAAFEQDFALARVSWR
jgi:hypothetical protein